MKGKSISKKKRAMSIRKKFMTAGITFILLLAVVFTTKMHAYAGSSEAPRAYTYYTGVEIHQGDTIWELADRYMEGGTLSKREYVSMICKMNHINSGRLLPGQVVIFEYYSNEKL